MSESFKPEIVTIDAEPFIFAPMELVRNIISRNIATGRDMSGVAEVLAIIVRELEWVALSARLTNRTHVFHGRLTEAEVLQRARELQDLPLS